MIETMESCKKTNTPKARMEQEIKVYNAYKNILSEHNKRRKGVKKSKLQKISKAGKATATLGKLAEDTDGDDKESCDIYISKEMQGKFSIDFRYG